MNFEEVRSLVDKLLMVVVVDAILYKVFMNMRMVYLMKNKLKIIWHYACTWFKEWNIYMKIIVKTAIWLKY